MQISYFQVVIFMNISYFQFCSKSLNRSFSLYEPVIKYEPGLFSTLLLIKELAWSSASFSKYLSVWTSFLFLSVPHLWMYTSLHSMRTTVRALVSGGYLRINPCNTPTRRTTRERLSINLASPSPPFPQNPNPQPPPLHLLPHRSLESVFVICLGYIIQRSITNHYPSAHRNQSL